MLVFDSHHIHKLIKLALLQFHELNYLVFSPMTELICCCSSLTCIKNIYSILFSEEYTLSDLKERVVNIYIMLK